MDFLRALSAPDMTVDLVNDATIDLMSERDQEVKERLIHLHERARPLQSTSSRAAIVGNAIADKLDRFYDFVVDHQRSH